jgi:hypothetical protein
VCEFVDFTLALESIVVKLSDAWTHPMDSSSGIFQPKKSKSHYLFYLQQDSGGQPFVVTGG